MTEPIIKPQPTLTDQLIGWAFTAAYAAHGTINVLLPRTAKVSPMREEYRGWHYVFGLALGIIAATLAYRWYKRGMPELPESMSGNARRWSNALVIASVAILVAVPLFGILNAWSNGLSIHFGPLPNFPSLIAQDRALWLFVGYFHAALAFAAQLLQVVILITAGYFTLRYNVGLVSGFYPGFGTAALLGVAITVYALTTFHSPEPGPRAVAILLTIVAAVWLASIGIRRVFGPLKSGKPAQKWSLWGGPAVIAGVVFYGLYGPYLLFRVTPFERAPTVTAATGVTSHDKTVTVVEVAPETSFEREVRTETFKWCAFCHTFNKGGQHLAGPNLYAIFGQRVASVPNFPYSRAFTARGAKGAVWTDKLMSDLLENPDKFAPGTTMVISSGPISEANRRAAVINILKKETMGNAVKVINK